MTTETDRPRPWWQARRDELLAMMDDVSHCYVYDLPTVRRQCRRLMQCGSVARVWYPLKTNAHPGMVAAILEEGLGLECVSIEEVRFALAAGAPPDRVFFTPNFASRGEYAEAIEHGVYLTVDGHYPLEHWPELFAGCNIFARFNPDRPRGHHRHVHTAGPKAKFGIPLHEAEQFRRRADSVGATIIGLHAHAGSGIDDARHWHEIALVLSEVVPHFPEARVFDLGGGLGVPKSAGHPEIDLDTLDSALESFRADCPDIELWMEPGRYVAAQAGVLLARVTQIKYAHGQRFIGVSTGMNSLIRPALYEAWHEIVNLSRLGEADAGLASIVGPICESADALGVDRMMPETAEGDVLLIANAGAYGRVMASSYNMRDPAGERTLA